MNLPSLRAVGLALGLTMVAGDALAVPAFARRYEVACSACHQIFPKLNRIGERFKERGFRFENEKSFDRSAWLKSAPISGRLQGTRYIPEDRDPSNAGYLKVLSAGNVGPRFSYWIDDAWRRSGGSTQHVEPDNAWVRLDLKPAVKLYARAGRFELDVPFTQTRTPHLLPYSVYGINTGLESDAIGFHQQGLEIGGELGRTHLSAALVQGRNFQPNVDLAKASGVGDPGRFDANLFLRASRQISESRVGAFAYIGRNDIVARLNATQVGVARDGILRFGVDGNTWIWKINVYGVAVYGRNSNSVLSLAAPAGTRDALGFASGFLAADYHLRKDMAVTAQLQASTVDQPGTLPRYTLSSFLPGVQMVIWKVKISGQMSLTTNNVGRFGALQIETAF